MLICEKLKYEFTDENVIEVTPFAMSQNWANQQPMLKYVFIGVAFVIGGQYGILPIVRGEIQTGIWSLVLFSCILFLGKPILLFIARQRAKLQLKNPENRKGLGVQTLELSNEGLLHSAPLAQSTYKYHAISKIEEKARYGLIFLTSDRFIAIPLTKVLEGNYVDFLKHLRAYCQQHQEE